MKTAEQRKIIEKQRELIVYLKAVTISHSPDDKYEEKLISELAALEAEEEEHEPTYEEIYDEHVRLLEEQLQKSNQDCANCPANLFYLANTERIMNEESGEVNQGTELPPVEGKDTDEIIEVLKKYERQIDDSDYHDVAIFDCDYKAIADELEQHPAKELFEKVYIRSEEDLPEGIILHVGNKAGFEELVYIEDGKIKKPFKFDEYDTPVIKIKNIVWYLRPVE